MERNVVITLALIVLLTLVEGCGESVRKERRERRARANPSRYLLGNWTSTDPSAVFHEKKIRWITYLKIRKKKIKRTIWKYEPQAGFQVFPEEDMVTWALNDYSYETIQEGVSNSSLPYVKLKILSSSIMMESTSWESVTIPPDPAWTVFFYTNRYENDIMKLYVGKIFSGTFKRVAY